MLEASVFTGNRDEDRAFTTLIIGYYTFMIEYMESAIISSKGLNTHLKG